MFNVHIHRSKAAKALLAVLAAAGMCAALAACGNSSSPSSSSAASSLPKLEGVSATGESGKEPEVHFKSPLQISQKSYAVLIPGTGARLKEGDTVCYQYMAYNARTGALIDSTWKQSPSCSLTLNSSMDPGFEQALSSQNLGASVAFGTPGSGEGQSASGTANSGDAYISVMTLVSVLKTLSKAEGAAVENIPSYLPKVTSDPSTGKPSLDFNGYKSDGKFVSQTIIKGSGPVVSPSGSVVVKYSGWVLGSEKLFQSTWNEGNTTASFSLSGTIEGFQKGLAGQTVGSQVLLIIPPNMGYGSQAQSGIPANSTLVFVVDILGAGN